jgi:hypothetical protein
MTGPYTNHGCRLVIESLSLNVGLPIVFIVGMLVTAILTLLFVGLVHLIKRRLGPPHAGSD